MYFSWNLNWILDSKIGLDRSPCLMRVGCFTRLSTSPTCKYLHYAFFHHQRREALKGLRMSYQAIHFRSNFTPRATEPHIVSFRSICYRNFGIMPRVRTEAWACNWKATILPLSHCLSDASSSTLQ